MAMWDLRLFRVWGFGIFYLQHFNLGLGGLVIISDTISRRVPKYEHVYRLGTTDTLVSC